jgi:peptidoglycan/LPS O-acetylase OafA/YrhL
MSYFMSDIQYLALSNPVSPLFAVAVLLTAFFIAYILNKINPSKEFQKYRSLDGLRGLAAVFVFIHHSSIWYFYKKSNIWAVPPSKLYTQLGQGAVTTFFMMTAFLFWGKIRESSRVDWVKLYSARIMRLAPLYYFSIFIMFVFAVFMSKDVINNVPSLKTLLHYLLFTIGGVPNVFGVNNTFVLDAGVTWTLPYEWFFYLSLPVFFIATKKPQASRMRYYLIIPLWVVLLYYMNKHFLGTRELAIFLFGIFAYEIYALEKFKSLKLFAAGKYGSLIVIALSMVIVFYFNTAYNNYALFLYFLIFTIISLGNNMFGLLTSGPARKLGEISYSVYLLQGFFLYVAFGLFTPESETPFHHWAIDLFVVAGLVVISQLTFYLIERKFIRSSEHLSKKIKTLADSITKCNAVE